MTAPFADRPDIVHGAICGVVGAVFPTSSEELLFGQVRRVTLPVDWVRQVAMYVAVNRYGLTMTRAGRLFDRDRTTVLHAVRRVGERCAANAVTAAFVDLIDGETFAQLRRLEAAEAVGEPIPTLPEPAHD